MLRCIVASAAFMLLLTASSRAQKLSKAEIAKRGKASTALVEVKSTRKGGTAFCVHSDGYFITNAHVIRGAENADITLVLNPSLKDQRILIAKVVRSDNALDLALLRTDKPGPLTALPLGSIGDVTELMDVFAFGFPFGRALAANEKEYPAISVNAGNVNSLRRKGTELDRIQLDVALNPGNSGGPVLDQSGKVIGVVVAGAAAARINLAIPVNHVSNFLARPELTLTLPVVSAADRHKPAIFKAHAVSLLPGGKPFALELALRPEGGTERKVPMDFVNGLYQAATAPAPVAEGPTTLRVELKYPSGTLSGSIADRAFRVGQREVKLSAVRMLRLRPKPQVELLDGTTIEGPITALGIASIEVGGDSIRVELAKAAQIQIEPPAEPEAVACVVIARRDGKELARVEETLALQPAAPGKAVSVRKSANAKVHAPALSDDKVMRKLPGTISDVVVGGGGRYLLLNLADARKLAVFDANEAKIIKYLSMPDDDILIAAGKDQFFVAVPTKNALQRWSLATFERELSVPLLPGPGAVRGFAMGSASQGPLVIGIVPPDKYENGSFLFVDPKTMKPMTMKWTNNTGPVSDLKTRPLSADSWYLRASADGTLFTLRPGIGGEPHEVFSISVHGRQATARHAWLHASILRPSDAGRVIYAPDGIYNADFQFLFPKPRPDREDMSKPFLPATQGNYFLRIQPGAPNEAGSVYLFLPGNDRSIAKLDGVEGLFHEDVHYGKSEQPLAHDKRVHLIADAKILVTIPTSRDQLFVYRFDLDKLIEASGVDYLFVTSAPPSTAAKGLAYDYQIVVKSKKGGVKYKLDAGPEGMAITPDGRLRWKVPADFGEKAVDVIISVNDASGQEVLHSFKVSTGG